MTNQSKYFIFVLNNILFFSITFVSGQFEENSISETDCNIYCNEDCSKYLYNENNSFSKCATVNINCSCGLSKASIVVIVVGALIFILIGICGFCCHKKYSNKLYTGRRIDRNGTFINPIPSRTTHHLTYIDQRIQGPEIPPYYRSIQPAFNPRYAGGPNAVLPIFNILHSSLAISDKLDPPPSYDEAVGRTHPSVARST